MDPVQALAITTKLESDKVISCSQDWDLWIWKKTDAQFVKKYDLSSFTAESVTCMCLGKDQNQIFVGSKD